MSLNIYKTEELLDAYSINADFTDPISPEPDVRYDGVSGDFRDFKLFLKNDGLLPVSEVLVTPADNNSPPSESVWMTLSITLVGLETDPAGFELSLPDIAVGAYETFWMRIEVPAGTPFQTKQELALRVTALE